MQKITFVGDIMCEMQQNKVAFDEENNTYCYEDCFSEIKSLLKKSDYIVGNLETPIAGEKLGFTNHIWSFNTPDAFLVALKKCGFNLVSTANNHCLDRGIEGLKNTIQALDNVKIAHTGTYATKEEKQTLCIKEIDGIRLGFLSYTYGTNAAFNKQYLQKNNQYMVNLFANQEQEIKRYQLWRRLKRKLDKKSHLSYLKYDVQAMKENNVDFIILCMHSGGQHNAKPDVYTKFLMEQAKNIGVDIVIGCHPHVVHNYEITKNFIGAYSLGNFFCTPGTSSSPIDVLSDYSILLHFYIEKKDKKAEIKKVTFSIAKTVIDEFKSSKVVLLCDYIKKLENDKKCKILKEDYQKIYNIFCDKEEKNVTIQEEHEIKIY